MAMRLPCHALIATALALGLSSVVLAAAEATVTRTSDGAQYIEREGLRFLSLIGDAHALGRQAGELTEAQTRIMLGKLSLLLLGMPQVPKDEADGNAIPVEYRDEINAWAAAAKIDPAVLMQVNLAVGSLCTAVVREPEADTERPLLLARNMDFRPASELGPRSMLIVRRPTGAHASLAVSWPGYVGVVSGMNDAGVCACLLLNRGAKRNTSGEYMGFRLRTILDHAGSLQEALVLFAATPVASPNYVMLADTTSSAVVWWSKGGIQSVDPLDGWQFCTNDPIDPGSHRPEDARATHAYALSRTRSDPDVTWMKGLLAASYLRDLNAQAMVFVPATRTLHLATASAGGKPAALSTWHEMDGARLMAGEDLATVPLVSSPAINDPPPHYTEKNKNPSP